MSSSASTGLDGFQIEKDRFNTGPCASRTLPTQYHMVSTPHNQNSLNADDKVQNSQHSFPPQPQLPPGGEIVAAPPASMNDAYFLAHQQNNSSGSGFSGLPDNCCFDVEQPPATTAKDAASVPECADVGEQQPPPAKKSTAARKRKHQDPGGGKSGNSNKGSSRSSGAKKITDFISLKTPGCHPLGNFGSSPIVINGDSSSNEGGVICQQHLSAAMNSVSPTPNTFILTESGQPLHRTPTTLCHCLPQHHSSNIVPLYSSSDSSQSPPREQLQNGQGSSGGGGSNGREVEAQTDLAFPPTFVDESSAIAQLRAYIQEQQRTINDLKLKVDERDKALDERGKALDAKSQKLRTACEIARRLLIEQSRMERKQAKERCSESKLRVGEFKPTRFGDFREQWMDGFAMEELIEKLKSTSDELKAVEVASKNLRRRKTAKDANKARSSSVDAQSTTSSLVAATGGAASTTGKISSDSDGFLRPADPARHADLFTWEPPVLPLIYENRKTALKSMEDELMKEKDRLERSRNLHIREMRRIQSEEQSRYRNYEILNDRYLPLSLLGKGGFSEVWRAFDLDEYRYVACKIHHVNKDWKEDKKANYVKHAMREKDIHMSLAHPSIVRLFDLFTIDNDSFCTVLEYCDGNDLDFYLKQQKQISEKESRGIIIQMVYALKYLSDLKNPVIHYDLKPANILLQSNKIGEIKLTDFGLSKTMENSDDGDESIELTSQGAGTYWYLPPETFAPYSDSGPPKISNKVDVWSVGVILYQCLYGRRPFGHEKTQQQILEERTIYNATEVIFPTTKGPSAVSNDAKDFIRRCLQCRKDERADVNELLRHPFLHRNQKTQQPASPSSRSAQLALQSRSFGESKDDFEV